MKGQNEKLNNFKEVSEVESKTYCFDVQGTDCPCCVQLQTWSLTIGPGNKSTSRA